MDIFRTIKTKLSTKRVCRIKPVETKVFKIREDKYTGTIWVNYKKNHLIFGNMVKAKDPITKKETRRINKEELKNRSSTFYNKSDLIR